MQKAATIHVLLAALLGSLAASSTNADITGFGVSKGIGFQQTTDAFPNIPNSIWGSVDIYFDGFDNPADLPVASVSIDGSEPLILGQTPTGPGRQSFGFAPGLLTFSKGFTSTGTFLEQFPLVGNYQFTVAGGQYGTQSATITTSDLLYPGVPHFTDNSYTRLQNMDSTQPFNFTWEGTTPPGMSAFVLFDIERVADGTSIFDGLPILRWGDSSFTSLLLPANTLLPDEIYQVSVVYSSGATTDNAGFGGAQSFEDYFARTDLRFTTAAVPEASTLLLGTAAGLGFLAFYRKSRKST